MSQKLAVMLPPTFRPTRPPKTGTTPPAEHTTCDLQVLLTSRDSCFGWQAKAGRSGSTHLAPKDYMHDEGADQEYPSEQFHSPRRRG